MTKSTATKPAAIAPALPNASVDFNKVLANDAKGKTGHDLYDGALIVPESKSDSDEAAAVDTTTDKPAA